MSIDLHFSTYFPGFLVPPEAHPYFAAGFLLVVLSIYTLTIDNASSLLFRLAVAPIAIHLFWTFGFGPFETPLNQVSVGMAVMGVYGIMRVIETTVVGMLDESPPHWVKDGKALPLPETVSQRLLYSFDLATSLRGNSWFSDRHWDWAPRRVTTDSPTAHMTHREFLLDAAWTLFSEVIVRDILDTLNKSREWDMTKLDPITSLSVPEQLVFSLSVCAGTALDISFSYTFNSAVAVALGSSPSSWPPMFNQPFSATSLRDFWANHWHLIFRRVFDRLSIPFLLPFPPYVATDPPTYKHVRKVVRALVVFSFTTALHILLMHRLRLDVRSAQNMRPVKAFLDVSILRFFLSQPLGLAIEASLVHPLANILLLRNEKWRRFVSRTYVWCFMLWAGRYWSDVFVHRGFWHPDEPTVGYSIVRGLLWGQWTM